MEHNEFREKIALYFYGELSEQERVQFEQHKIQCEECSVEYEKQFALLNDLKRTKGIIVNDRILSSARYQLGKALRQEFKTESGSLIDKYFSFLFTPFRFVSSLAIVLTIGLMIGYVLSPAGSSLPVVENTNGEYFNTAASSVFNEKTIRISNVHFVDADASDGEIEFEFEAITPVRMKGPVNDSEIQKVLAYSMLNNMNPGSRLNSINAIESKQLLSVDNETKNALLTVMLTDENPGVRLEALKVLKRLPYDEIIKQGFLTVLTSDTTSGLRIEAVNAISELIEKGLSFSQDELSLLKERLINDDNDYIKFRSATILKEYN
jgi:hypothetical protein